jgi:hypothetical protein
MMLGDMGIEDLKSQAWRRHARLGAFRSGGLFPLSIAARRASPSIQDAGEGIRAAPFVEGADVLIGNFRPGSRGARLWLR